MAAARAFLTAGYYRHVGELTVDEAQRLAEDRYTLQVLQREREGRQPGQRNHYW